MTSTQNIDEIPGLGALGPPPPHRYANLLDVSGSLQNYGLAMKLIGILAGVGALLCGLVGAFVFGGWGIAIGIVGVFFGIILHATGTVIAAMGESMLALADIATNSAPR